MTFFEHFPASRIEGSTQIYGYFKKSPFARADRLRRAFAAAKIRKERTAIQRPT